MRNANRASPTNGRGGRPGNDWPALFDEWKRSGLTKAKFLRAKGFAYQGGTVAVNTRDWVPRLRQEALAMTNLYTSSVGNQHVVAEVPAEAAPPGTTDAVPGTVPWEFVVRRRGEQATADWLGADQLRRHVASKLANAWSANPAPRADGARSEATTLTAVELKQLADALSMIQRVQRLALGLSTDNVGVEPPLLAAAHVAANPGKVPNLFVVQLTKNGKFVTARPRQVPQG